MEKIPSAEEFIESKDEVKWVVILTEFAKLHVEKFAENVSSNGDAYWIDKFAENYIKDNIK